MENETRLADRLRAAEARGHGPWLLTMLDVLAPLAPILAQSLLIAQPLARSRQWGRELRELADLLEAPDGLEQLRRQLATQQEE